MIGRYTQAEIEHIFLGYDHIAFLAAVVLWARRLWPVVKVVTAFTIAHSITLSLTALDIVRIPSSIIEPAIARRGRQMGSARTTEFFRSIKRMRGGGFDAALERKRGRGRPPTHATTAANA